MAAFLRRLVPLVFVALAWTPAAYAWSWPAQGPVLRPFSFDPSHPYVAGQHRGIDVGAPAGANVVAPADGTVTFAGSVPTSGTSLTILTADGYAVTLTHLGTLAVERGASVAEGDVVGAVGPSGTPELDVPYVHLGVRTSSDPNGYLDPLSLLPAIAPPSPPAASGAPADSSAPPVEAAPAPSATVPVASTPVSVVDAPSSALAPAPAVPSAVPATPATAATPADARATSPARTPQARSSATTPQHSRPAPVRAPVPARDAVAVEQGVGRAHAGWQPRPAAQESVPLRHRPVPVPVPTPGRERPAIRETRSPVVSLALGAGAATLALALLAGVLCVRRRPAAPPGAGAVVIPLPRRIASLEERRVA